VISTLSRKGARVIGAIYLRQEQMRAKRLLIEGSGLKLAKAEAVGRDDGSGR